MKSPSISVIMCNYNHSRYLRNALQALVDQSDPPDEIVVLDDGSTDGSPDIIQSFVDRYPHFRFLRNDRNRGFMYSFHRVWEASSCEWVLSTAADDLVLPTMIEKSRRLIRQFPQTGLCCSESYYDHERSGTRGHLTWGWCKEPRYFSPEAVSDWMRWTERGIAAHTAVFNREAFEQAGRYVPELESAADWFAVNVIAFRRGICHIPEPLAVMRLHSESYSAKIRAQSGRLQRALGRLLRLLKTPRYRDVHALFRRSTACSFFGRLIVEAVIRDPFLWDPKTLSLIWRSALRAVRRGLRPALPLGFRRWYGRVRDAQCAAWLEAQRSRVP